MRPFWLLIAAMIEFLGALLIVVYAVRAIGIVLRERQAIDRAQWMVAQGAITGLDRRPDLVLIIT